MSGPGATIAWRHGRPVGQEQFLADVDACAARLGPEAEQINLCQDRYAFLVCFAAALREQRMSLLPASAAQAQIDALAKSRVARSGTMDEALLDPAPGVSRPLNLQRDQAAILAFSSGSSGEPQAIVRTWSELADVADCSSKVVLPAAGTNLVSCVPQQHLFGLEFTAVMPLVSDCAISQAAPFYPADIARALHEIPAPRLLVSTPLQLRTLVEAQPQLPPMAGVLCATAPLSEELANRVEQAIGARVTEIYGCTEAGSIAWRHPTTRQAWTLHPGYTLEPGRQGTRLMAPSLSGPVELQDLVDVLADGRFRLLGRSGDLVKVAGKRASLTQLTGLLLEAPGVRDGVIFAPHDQEDARLAALVVAPGVSAASIAGHLRSRLDPVFVPRPLRLVERLPRNSLGKLPRAALLAELERSLG